MCRKKKRCAELIDRFGQQEIKIKANKEEQAKRIKQERKEENNIQECVLISFKDESWIKKQT